jgi:hypothetical protein
LFHWNFPFQSNGYLVLNLAFKLATNLLDQ